MYIRVICYAYLVTLSVLDAKTQRVPDAILLSFFITIFCQDLSKETSLKIAEKVISGILIFSILLVVAIETKGLGLGDVKLAGILGYSEEFFKTNIIFLIASILGLLFFVLVKSIGKKVKRIAFVPFITAGYAVTEIIERKVNAFF